MVGGEKKVGNEVEGDRLERVYWRYDRNNRHDNERSLSGC
jgi:hypothetical protein